jgi:hypothetical protein
LLIRRGQVRAGPVDRLLSELVEIARGVGEAGLLVVIAFYDRAIELSHDLDTFVRIGVVADDVAETDEVGAFLLMRVFEDGFGRLEIGVEITENGEAHEPVWMAS